MRDADEIDAGWTVSRGSAVAGVELDGEAVLYHEELQTVYVLNPTATVVWACLDGSSDLEGLVVELAEAFAVEVSMVRGDVLEVVREFGRQGLLEGVEPDPDVVALHTLSGPDADAHEHHEHG